MFIFCIQQIWAYFFILLVLTSSILAVIDTHPSFRVPASSNLSAHFQFNITNPKAIKLSETRVHPGVKITCDAITFVFLVELLVRFTLCPSKCDFFKSFFNIFDIISVVPSSALTLVKLVKVDLWKHYSTFTAYMFSATFRVLRIVRIFKIIRHNKGLQLIVLAIKASGNEILLLFTLMGIGKSSSIESDRKVSIFLLFQNWILS